jgi:hypothetical protein
MINRRPEPSAGGDGVNPRKCPISVMVLAWVYIAVGTLGFVGHFRDSLASPAGGVWIELTEILAVVAGVFLLRGHNWARWLAIAWIAFHVIISAFNGFRESAIHALFCALIAWLLLRSASSRYFRPSPESR